jgi:sulfate permease, SulP family
MSPPVNTPLRALPGHALRRTLAGGYRSADLRADLGAGLTVGVVAVPLSMALAIASGVPPQHGLYTAIIAGIAAALLGGARFQVTGPTAAFVVLLVPVVTRFGLGGLLLAGLMAGLIQIAMGLARMGRLITFIPHPVTTGFTAGIALVIATIQLKDVFGLELAGAPEGWLERVEALWAARASASGWELAVTAFTLALLIAMPRLTRRVPGPLIALTAAAAAAAALAHLAGIEVATVGSRFVTEVDGSLIAGIPRVPPTPLLPWSLPGPGGAALAVDWALIRAIAPAAFAIAMLGAIESLLSAVVSDQMSGTRHEPNSELLALGAANVLCPFFGGIPATGALARTATNIRSGARTPLSSVYHALFVLACTVALAPLVAYLPMAALAALLLIVARNMSEARHALRLVRVAPKSDVLVLVTCFALTVVFDMVVAVGVGVVLAALLFMRRMAELTQVNLDPDPVERLGIELPAGVRHLDIGGPLFFGAAERATSVLDVVGAPHTIILSMSRVPVMDATGLVALESIISRWHGAGRKVILVGALPQPRGLLERAGLRRRPGQLAYAPDLETAVSMALLHQARLPAAVASP